MADKKKVKKRNNSLSNAFLIKYYSFYRLKKNHIFWRIKNTYNANKIDDESGAPTTAMALLDFQKVLKMAAPKRIIVTIARKMGGLGSLGPPRV